MPILSERSFNIIGGLIWITFDSSELVSSLLLSGVDSAESSSISLDIGGKIPPTLFAEMPGSLFLFFRASLFSCSSNRDRASLPGEFIPSLLEEASSFF